MQTGQRIFQGSGAFVACVITIWMGGLIEAYRLPLQEKEEVRDIQPTSWYKNRPKSKVLQTSHKPLLYRRRTSPLKSPVTVDDAEVGITIWRIRRSTPSDEKEVRELIYDNKGKEEEWTPERLEDMATIAEGERFRLAIETPRAGYLYVINRAKYADGTYSSPYLIFPTLDFRDGDNRIRAGRTIEIPARADRPPYFSLKRSRSAEGSEEVSEEVIVVVALKPLPDIAVRPSRQKLSEEQVARWQKQWGAETERWELIGGAGKSYTKAEKKAADGKGDLGQDDPFPQTIYRIAAKFGNPILVSVQLPIGG
jgi:hypothetical protein